MGQEAVKPFRTELMWRREAAGLDLCFLSMASAGEATFPGTLGLNGQSDGPGSRCGLQQPLSAWAPWSLQTCPCGPGDLEARVAVGGCLRYCGP